MQHLHNKTYNNEFVNNFPGDETGSKQPRQTPGMLYSLAIPTPVKNPKILAWSEELAAEIGIAPPDEKDEQILGGNLVTGTMKPYAACYAGHQFGNWAGQLGDGRAITLGEWETPTGQTWELQLKGPGMTAYSRRADGRAVLRSSVREYLMSEAMHYLGVPTTRALALVTTGEPVLRDMFYNGNVEYEPGAIVLRAAPSFLRFGSFEMPASRKEIDNLRKLVDWTIAKHYPHISGENKIITWFKEVADRTAAMIVEWLRVGFVHGVMNTDNMSILGLTIDYGPYSFLDDYDPNFTPNTIDLPGRRYAFGKQASIAKWNLSCLAGAIAPLFESTDELVAALEEYDEMYWQKNYSMMGNKLGFDKVSSQEDVDFINRFQQMLSEIKPDYTIFFQLLIDLSLDETTSEEITAHFNESFYTEPTAEQQKLLAELITDYRVRINKNTCTRVNSIARMRQSNPRFILRNYLLHQSIQELQAGKPELFLKLQEAIKAPYASNFDEFFAKRPAWATQQAGCSMLSCSS